MKAFDFALSILIVLGIFITISLGNVYAQSSTDQKTSTDSENSQLRPKDMHESASESATKSTRPVTEQMLNPVIQKSTQESPNINEPSAPVGHQGVTVDCCKAHKCCD